MGVFSNSVRVLLKRPFIILALGAVMLILSAINQYNPLFTVLFGLSTLERGSILQSFLSFLQIILNFMTGSNAVWICLYCLTSIALLSLLSGLFFSGYLNVINNTLDGKPKFKGEFSFGVKKYFSKITFATIRFLLLGIIFIAFMSVASIPSIVITKAVLSGRSELGLAMVAFDTITLMVLFFGFMFFRIYTFFWFPALLNFDSKPFTLGKHIADKFFWTLAGRFLAFDIVFLVFESIFIYISRIGSSVGNDNQNFGIVLFIFDFLFKTLFFSTFFTYIFTAFKTYAEVKE